MFGFYYMVSDYIVEDGNITDPIFLIIVTNAMDLTKNILMQIEIKLWFVLRWKELINILLQKN